MVNKNKVRGDDWERRVVELLTKGIPGSMWKKVPSSGALGTQLGEPLLSGDVRGEVDTFWKKFRAECKAGYNSSSDKEVKQFTLKKEWLDKITMEAEATHSIPLLFGKFSGARSGVKHFVVMDITTFIEFINEYDELKKNYDKLFDWIQEHK